MASALVVAGNGTGRGVNDALTRYLAISGNLSALATVDFSEIPVRDAGTFLNLFVYVSANTISVNSTTFTLQDSRVNTSVTVSYTSDQTGIKEDTTNTAAFTNTDEANYELVTPSEAGTNTITFHIIGIEFQPDTTTNCISFMCAQKQAILNDASATYNSLPHAENNTDDAAIAEAQCKYRVRGTFTSSNLYTYVNTNSRTTNTSLKTRKNGADGSQIVTYTSGQTGTKEDTTNTDSLAAGDDFNYQFTTGTGTQNISFLNTSSRLVSTASEFVLLSGDVNGTAYSANSTRYEPVVSIIDATATTEANAQIYPRFTFTAKELGAYVSVNGGASLATNITLRDNGADGNLTVSYLVGQTGLKNDSVNTDSIASGADEIDYEVTCLDLTGGVTITWIGVLGSTSVASGTAVAAVAQRMKSRMLMGVGL